ncbi:cytochrome P450 6g1-like [Musca autumnalis]|uniref:cytochrome P450 6g1-like n=1 Tax=Musca autumnalis TaxID=221902 RepID=UPI003CF2E4A7
MWPVFVVKYFQRIEIYDEPQYADAPVVGIYGLYKPSLLIRDPELIKSILIKDFDRFCCRFAKPDPHTDAIAANNVFFGDYKLWKEMRAKFSPMFSSGKLRSMYPLVLTVGKNITEHLKKQGEVFDLEVKDLCARYTTDVIATTILGFSSNSLENPAEQMNIETRKLGTFNLQRALHVMLIFFVPKLVRFFGAKLFYKESITFLKSSLRHIIKDREESGCIRNDLIDIVIKLKQELPSNDPKAVNSFLKLMDSQAIVFLAAGYETSSSTMSFALFELAKHMEIQEKLRKEINQAFKETKNGELIYEAFNAMEYLDMVVNETLRMYPVVPVLERKCGKAEGPTKPYSLMPYCDYAIPESMPVYISVYGLHYDSKYWPNPTKFQPERFSSESKRLINPMAYLPFGNGPHNCMGNRNRAIYEDPKFTDAPVVGIYGLYKPSLLIREPELIKSILIKDFDRFCNRVAKPDPHTDAVAANNVFFSDYKLWKETRKNFSPMFSSGKLRSMFPQILAVGDNMTQHLMKQGDVCCVEVKDLLARYTTDVIGTIILGFSSNALENPTEQMNIETRKLGTFDLRRALHMLLIFFAPKLAKYFGARVFDKDAVAFVKGSMRHIIKDREERGVTRNDLTGIAMKLKQQLPSNDPKQVNQFMELMGSQAVIFLVAGYETSATTMSFGLFELAKHPEIQEKLRKEIAQAFKDAEGGELSYEAFNEMEYLDMVVNETMRMYPAFPVLEREYVKGEGTTEPYSLLPYCDYNLPDGMPIYLTLFGLHYDPKYWSNPTQFDPERFSPENKHTINPMAFLPFGNGPHSCVANRMGRIQTKCGIMHALKNHYVRVCDRTKLQLDYDPRAFILQLKGGMHLEFVRDNMCENLKVE